jgi:hypothetical protein
MVCNRHQLSADFFPCRRPVRGVKKSTMCTITIRIKLIALAKFEEGALATVGSVFSAAYPHRPVNSVSEHLRTIVDETWPLIEKRSLDHVPV